MIKIANDCELTIYFDEVSLFDATDLVKGLGLVGIKFNSKFVKFKDKTKKKYLYKKVEGRCNPTGFIIIHIISGNKEYWISNLSEFYREVVPLLPMYC